MNANKKTPRHIAFAEFDGMVNDILTELENGEYRNNSEIDGFVREYLGEVDCLNRDQLRAQVEQLLEDEKVYLYNELQKVA